MRLVAVMAWLLVGCTLPNPSYVDDNPGGSGPLGGDGGASGAVDLSAGSIDLGDRGDLGNRGAPDLGPIECTSDQRRCAASPPASQECSSGHFRKSRECPVSDVGVLDAQCAGGYCAPPAGAQSCDFSGGPSEDYCFSQVSMQHSCQPFVDPASKSVSWSCAIIAGSGASGDACTDGSQCRSGSCGSNGTCFRPCGVSSDCPPHKPPWSCNKVEITVEGLKLNPTSCVP